MEDSTRAYVMALQCLARHEPFRSSRFGPIARTVENAARRRHIGFAYRNGKVCGVACWIFVSDEAAQRWLREGQRPDEENGLDGNTLIVLLGASDHPLAAFEMLRAMAHGHPEKNYMFSRLGGRPMQSGNLARWLPDRQA